MNKNVFVRFANALAAMQNCAKDGNREWKERWEDEITRLNDYLPSGSGFDSGSKLDLDRSKPDRLVFTTSFHHMNDVGYYDGWTEHDVIVKPSFIGNFDIRVTGRNRNDIKEYIIECFSLIGCMEDHDEAGISPFGGSQ